MADRVVIPLPGIGTLELDRTVYQAALRPIAATESKPSTPVVSAELVTAKALASTLSLPLSCVYEYAKTGRIPCVRAGKHVRFNPAAVLATLAT